MFTMFQLLAGQGRLYILGTEIGDWENDLHQEAIVRQWLQPLYMNKVNDSMLLS